jgi:folate-binding protein YgfZ
MTAFGGRIERDVVRVTGPDAQTFLQGQLSQDVAALAAGQSADSFLLQPTGKVEALLRVTKLADDEFLLDVDGGYGDAVVARLERFKLRTKADLERLQWTAVAVRGSTDVAPPLGGVVVPAEGGVDLLGPDVALPEGVRPAAPDELEVARILARTPRMGSELNESTIPAEAGVVDRAVSFTKGCYTGQELVARIDSRGGNVPRRLRLLEIPGPPPAPGADVVVDGKVVGHVTSSAPRGDGSVALAYLGRAVTVPADVEVGGVTASAR